MRWRPLLKRGGRRFLTGPGRGSHAFHDEIVSLAGVGLMKARGASGLEVYRREHAAIVGLTTDVTLRQMRHRFPRLAAGKSNPAVGSRLTSERTARAAFIRTTPESPPNSLLDHLDHPLTAPSLAPRTTVPGQLRGPLCSGHGAAPEDRGEERRRSYDFDLATCDGEMLYWTIETSGEVPTGISKWFSQLPVGRKLGTQSGQDHSSSSAGCAVTRSHRDTLNR